MLFKRLSEYFQQLESTSLRLKITEILAEMFKDAEKEEIGKLCYLLQGRVTPLYDSTEFGVADKMMIRAVAQGLDIETDQVLKEFKKMGDLGSATEKLKIKTPDAGPDLKDPQGLTLNDLKLIDVYEILYQVATSSGEGSQEVKVNLLSNLIKQIDPLSARYIVRLTLDKLRLGFSDMTVLDSLSWMIKGSKELRPEIERAYNLRPDLGYISQRIKDKGIKGIKHVQPVIGTPILMAKADRLKNSKEILEKIGRCAVEFKYDGLRLQVHYKKSNNFVKLFSRNLEDLTPCFPDISESVKKSVAADEAIFEGEIVAYNPQTGVNVAFQQTMQRRRKYDIEKKAAEIPVKLYVFELLYQSGKNLIGLPYRKRKGLLKKMIKEDAVLKYANETIVEKEEEIEQLFDDSVVEGYEGIIAKRLDGVYQAGMRGFSWIKFKRAMSKKLMDTFDVLVMGYTFGEGKRTIFGVGEFLTGVYDESQDKFVSITKIGTGLTDEQFREFKKRIAKLEIKEKPQRYLVDKLLEADVWLRPALVVEISADELTRSQVHTAGRILGLSKSGKAEKVTAPGYSLRFPRLERFRDDKKPDEATSKSELEKLFKLQKTAA